MVEQVAERAQPAPPPHPDEASRDNALTDLELNLLLEGVLRFSGLDFRDYAHATLKRRISERLRLENVRTISGLQELVLHDPEAFARFVLAMSGGVGQLFREPTFFALVRSRVVPLLRTYSFSRVWVPNCGRGEDAYSLATVLEEEDLLSRTMIYATDASALAIDTAKKGLFEIESAEAIKALHHATGAGNALSDHAEVRDDAVEFKPELRKNIIFAQHSLVADGSLNEFHV
ncbi:MAG TPA: CheR family methyltransferase, partial [Candidatus Baltobacteraceae bacterium]|nr:CheR family methyltransferase [Candidatus Baltobacteraceae bacterium]